MFGSDRFFSQRNGATGLTEWYFNAREGVFGPYKSKEMAVKVMEEFVEKHKLAGDDGGRSQGSQDSALSLSLESMQYGSAPREFDPLRRKKGLE